MILCIDGFTITGTTEEIIDFIRNYKASDDAVLHLQTTANPGYPGAELTNTSKE